MAETEAEVAAALRALAAGPAPSAPVAGEGRGIVMCAGGPRLLTCAWVTVALLRRTLGCALPIELWHLGPRELGPHEAALFAELGVETVDALEVRRRHPIRTLGGWELKPYAVAHSRFAEVLLLDADNVPVADPAALFDDEAYRAAGAMFWPDIVRLGEDNPIWDLCGVPFVNEPGWESGQALIDKARCGHALALVLQMNGRSDVFYEHLHGDKDTWHLAFRMLDQPVAMTRYPPQPTPSGVAQRGLVGTRLFQHRTLAKWVLRGENLLHDGFALQDECLAHLADLRRRWTGRVEEPGSLDPADAARAEEVVAGRWFAYERVGQGTRDLELLGDGRVGQGRAGSELRWRIDGGALVLEGAEGETARLVLDGGRWRGRLAEGMEVELRPAGGDGPVAGPLGATVAIVVRAAAEGALDPARALETLATLGEVGDVRSLLGPERRAWAGHPETLALLDALEARLGRADPSLDVAGRGIGQRDVRL